jgi:hypothetical protein
MKRRTLREKMKDNVQSECFRRQHIFSRFCSINKVRLCGVLALSADGGNPVKGYDLFYVSIFVNHLYLVLQHLLGIVSIIPL